MARGKSRLIRSVHFEREIARLKNGKRVDISESWKLNSFRRASHEFYEHVSNVYIDPSGKELSYQITFLEMRNEYFQDKRAVYRLKQDLYQMLQALISEEWMLPYLQFVKTIAFTCHGTRMDDFGNPLPYTFMKIVIPVSELIKRADTFFDVNQFHTISEVTFKDGQPL